MNYVIIIRTVNTQTFVAAVGPMDYDNFIAKGKEAVDAGYDVTGFPLTDAALFKI